MEPKTKQESEIYAQMLAMLADQFYHQQGNTITIFRSEFADMLTKQTMHGIATGWDELADQIKCGSEFVKEDVPDGNDGYFKVRVTDLRPDNG